MRIWLTSWRVKSWKRGKRVSENCEVTRKDTISAAEPYAEVTEMQRRV